MALNKGITRVLALQTISLELYYFQSAITMLIFVAMQKDALKKAQEMFSCSNNFVQTSKLLTQKCVEVHFYLHVVLFRQAN